jgi:predicted nucleic acid-binding protein
LRRAYFDAAYVAKCYLNESDAVRVRELAGQYDALHTSSLSLAELACAFHRQLRDGLLNKKATQSVQEQFRKDIQDGVWILEPVTEWILQLVEAKIGKFDASVFVRAGDAIHLVTAADAGFNEVWTSDRHMLAAAERFGLRGRQA